MEALAVANAQGLSLEPSTNAAGYRGVKITKRSRARPFQASPTSEPTGQGPSHAARSARSALSALSGLSDLILSTLSSPDDPLGPRVPGQHEARRQEHPTGQLRHGRGGRPVLRTHA
eukprot:scaffold3742_cov74-Phaeocystis_antarctica.AAC.6